MGEGAEGMKRPAFQFYPADWRKDAELQSCSIAARGLWHELLCVMHECEPYGHLTLNCKAMPDTNAARLVGVEAREFRKLLAELEAVGVPSRTSDGILYSRRMVRDEQLRNSRAEGGIAGGEHGAKGAAHGAKGGRPRKETGDKKPPLPNEQKPPLEPPPSSSSSSSVVLPTGVATSTEPVAVDNSATPEGDRSPEGQRQRPVLPRGWHKSNDGIERAASAVGIIPHPGEMHGEVKRRVFDLLAAWGRDGAQAA